MRGRNAGAALVLALTIGLPPASGAQPASDTREPVVTGYVRNWTRAEMWRFFEPPPGGGDPEYVHLANRLQFGLRRDRPVYDLVAALQFVQFGGLPRDATGPGPLGTGALYFDHSGRTDSRQLYLRYLNVRLRPPRTGLTIQAGRMPYASGAEADSGSPKIEAVKRQRLDARMIGEFEWSMYQRAFDGLRVDLARPDWQLTGAAFRPTQGGFEEEAGRRIGEIGVLAATLSVRPGRLAPGTQVQLFSYRYRDTRPVAARPDNTGLPAGRVDVAVNSFGGAAIGAWPSGGGEVDVFAWMAGQTGDWYGQPHRASAVALEAGYQWTRAPWRPWLRGGGGRASGDRDPADDRHGTFFQMLPTGRRYSLTATYSFMNLNDVFVQILLRPDPGLRLRGDVRQVSLASGADRWYAGSGATQQAGTIFGFAGRPSGGATSLGFVVEGSVDYALTPNWSIEGFAGTISGGDVVRRSFTGERLVFAYLENVFRF